MPGSSAVRVVQCLCAGWHCIMALAYAPGLSAAQRDFGSTDDITLTEFNAAPYLRSLVEGLIERGSLGSKCAICGSSKLSYEDKLTEFETVGAAELEVASLEEPHRSAVIRNEMRD